MPMKTTEAKEAEAKAKQAEPKAKGKGKTESEPVTEPVAEAAVMFSDELQVRALSVII